MASWGHTHDFPLHATSHQQLLNSERIILISVVVPWCTDMKKTHWDVCLEFVTLCSLLLLLLSCFSRSDSVWPHRRQPTRLPHPWDSPGKNTGVGCHFLLQCMKVKSEREVVQSYPTLCDATYCSYQAPPWDFPGKSTGVGCHRLLWLFLIKNGPWKSHLDKKKTQKTSKCERGGNLQAQKKLGRSHHNAGNYEEFSRRKTHLRTN